MNNLRGDRTARIENLHNEYRLVLDQSGKMLGDFLREMRAGRLSAERTAEMCQLAHRLSGSAGTYGYPEISRDAGQLETVIETAKPGDDDIKILSLVAILIERIAQAGLQVPVRQTAITPPVRSVTPQQRVAAPRRKVLIAEDDPVVTNLLESLMEAEIDIVVACDGPDALALAAREQPDLIILDNNLPGMSGLQVLTALHHNAATADVAVIMLTGNNDPANVVAAVNAGAIDYFTKPFEPIPFVNHVRSLLSNMIKRVLVVDDDRSVREILIHRFESLGIHATGADNGVTALEQVKRRCPDLIILDRMIPGLEGGAVLMELKRNAETSEVPIIILTARNAAGEAHEWLRRGAAEFISKPFDPNEVVLRARRILGVDDED